MKKILHLTIKRKWFDLIASGKKTVEYREHKPYWQKRLDGDIFKFQEVHFRNGYRKDAPFMRVKCLGIVTVPDSGGFFYKPVNGEVLKGWQFVIVLGPVLEVKNYYIDDNDTSINKPGHLPGPHEDYKEMS